ncbi:MAG: O-antigen ligase family protein, partial [Neisseriaceae bacterium]|nr:O-antigen ligase family protein [Neisseriaceae bacterium]
LLALIHEESFSSIKFELIPLVLLPAFLFFCYILNHTKALNYIFPIATIIIGIYALYDKYIQGAERALETQQPVIPAAGIVITLSLFCLNFFFVYYKKNKTYSLFALMACLLGVTASVLTGFRGAWLCFPIVFILLFIRFRAEVPRVVKTVLIPVILTLFILFLFLYDTGITLRFEQIKTDLIWYFQDNNPNSSIGLRFEFWKSAIDGFLQEPLLGWGDANYIAMKELQAQNGLIIPEAIPFVHAHNQFLDVLVKKGVFLFLATVAILLVPLRMFYKYRQRNEIISILGYILIFDVFTFCLSDSFLRLSLGMIFYMMTVYMLLGFLIKYESD